MINYQKKCTHWQLTQLYLKKCNLYKNNVYFMNPQGEDQAIKCKSKTYKRFTVLCESEIILLTG